MKWLVVMRMGTEHHIEFMTMATIKMHRIDSNYNDSPWKMHVV